MNPVVGVDGARGGWVVAEYERSSGSCSLRFVEALASVADSLRGGDITTAVIDMPIGLPLDGNRPADALARARLGPRRATFFPTPLRGVLDCGSWEEANERSRMVSGRGLSKQSWNLVPKILEVDNEWTNELRETLVEGHPEITFSEMAGSPLLAKKSTPEGERNRVELLSLHLTPDVPRLLDDVPRAWRTDAIDALALAWTADRSRTGTAIRLGGELDPLGRPMQLVI